MIKRLIFFLFALLSAFQLFAQFPDFRNKQYLRDHQIASVSIIEVALGKSLSIVPDIEYKFDRLGNMIYSCFLDEKKISLDISERTFDEFNRPLRYIRLFQETWTSAKVDTVYIIDYTFSDETTYTAIQHYFTDNKITSTNTLNGSYNANIKPVDLSIKQNEVYDGAGNLISYTWGIGIQETHGCIVEEVGSNYKCVFTYNAENICIEEKTFENGLLKSQKTMRYDGQNLPIRLEIIEYDEKGKAGDTRYFNYSYTFHSK